MGDNMKKKLPFLLTILFLFSLLLFYSGCSNSPVSPGGNTPGVIPADPADSLLPQTVVNNLSQGISNPLVTISGTRVALQIAGVYDSLRSSWIPFKGTGAGENIWISEDCDNQGNNGKNKGILVTKLGSGTTGAADIVFTVDISGSMGNKADSIASQISSFVSSLSSSLDIRVGCVGYCYYYGEVTGAINLTSVQNLRNYLNRSGYTGTSRCYGFSGPDSADLSLKANGFNQDVYNEDGIIAITYADTFFTWRSNAYRVYINITDEAIQPGGNQYFSTAGLESRWTSAKGTIHTVFAIDNNYFPDTTIEHSNSVSWSDLYQRPWLISYFTGGTLKLIHSDCSDLDLKTLPVTGSLANSYKIEFTKTHPSQMLHNLVLVIVNQDSVKRLTPRSDGKRVFTNLTY